MPKLLIAFCLIGVPTTLSIYSTLGVFYPKIRGKWRGSDKILGNLSSIGTALFFDAIALIVWGLILLPMGLMNRLAPFLLPTSLVGFILMVFGYFRDMRREQ